MNFKDIVSPDGKTRIVQELVPGKQVTLAHIIAGPDQIIYKKLGLDPAVMASPFITTIVDAVSLLIYFAIASLVLL